MTKDQKELIRLKQEYFRTVEICREGEELIRERQQATEILARITTCDEIRDPLAMQKRLLQQRKKEWGLIGFHGRSRKPKADSNNSIPGQKFGRLTVQFRFQFDPDVHDFSLQQYNGHWQCLCECGTTVRLRLSSLTGKNPTKSCGCLKADLIQQRREIREAKQAEKQRPRIELGFKL